MGILAQRRKKIGSEKFKALDFISSCWWKRRIWWYGFRYAWNRWWLPTLVVLTPREAKDDSHWVQILRWLWNDDCPKNLSQLHQQCRFECYTECCWDIYQPLIHENYFIIIYFELQLIFYSRSSGLKPYWGPICWWRKHDHFCRSNTWIWAELEYWKD